MKILDKLLGPSRTNRPLPSYRPFYVERFTALATRLTDVLFRNVQLHVAEECNLGSHRKIVIYCNHPSFWDPVILATIHRVMLPDHAPFTPIDETALKRHWYFHGLGFFGIPLSSTAGYRRFREVFDATVSHPEKSCFIVTPQGRFSNNLIRPIVLQRGLSGALMKTESDLCVVPLALDYSHSQASGRSASALLGGPVNWKQYQAQSDGLSKLHRELERRLEIVLDQLMKRSSP